MQLCSYAVMQLCSYAVMSQPRKLRGKLRVDPDRSVGAVMQLYSSKTAKLQNCKTAKLFY